MAVYNIFVKLLDGTTTTLKFSSPTISLETLKQDLYTQTQILPQNQRLITGTHNLDSKTLITLSPNATIHLLGRLLGGKGGFGSLLRGAATKAGQKKTNNFDACRDMSGRRLRHVNSEKRLEEWKLEEAERKLEKIAEEFIKKKMKEVKKSGGGKDDKYFEKFNKESKDCREKMEASVKASFGMYEENKRKMMPGAAPTSKRLKLSFRMKEDESDSDSDEEDVAVLDEKSVVLNDANPEKRNKNGEGSSASVYKIQSDGESSGGGSSIQSTVEEEHGITTGGSSELGESSASGAKTNGLFGPESMNDADWVSDVRVHNDKSISVGVESDICQETKGPSLGDSSPEVIRTVEGSERKGSSAEANGSVDETTVVSTVDSDQEKPLNFDDYSSAAEMEVLGIERLKAELTKHGLKCGGTLQERAARLFLLKTTPLEKLPKKLLAKK